MGIKQNALKQARERNMMIYVSEKRIKIVQIPWRLSLLDILVNKYASLTSSLRILEDSCLWRKGIPVIEHGV